MPKWRKTTWTLVIWNLLIFAWVVTGIAANISAIGQFVIWLTGSALLVLVWLMSRSRYTTLVYGPQGTARVELDRTGNGNFVAAPAPQPARAPR